MEKLIFNPLLSAGWRLAIPGVKIARLIQAAGT
jgi:hypothetical protein